MKIIDIWKKKYKQLLLIVGIIGVIVIFFGELLIRNFINIENITFGEKMMGALYYLTALIIFWYTRETYDIKTIQNKQIEETRKSTKYLEYSSRPTAFLLLFRGILYVKSTSSFLIKFYFKMEINNRILSDEYWEVDNPLYIYPGGGFMQFPNAFDPKKLVTGKIKIEYRLIPGHINDPNLYTDTQIVEWQYDKKSGRWRGPNGLAEEGVLSFFSKRTRFILAKTFPRLKKDYPESFLFIGKTKTRNK